MPLGGNWQQSCCFRLEDSNTIHQKMVLFSLSPKSWSVQSVEKKKEILVPIVTIVLKIYSVTAKQKIETGVG